MKELTSWNGWKRKRLLGSGNYGKVYEVEREIPGHADGVLQGALKAIPISGKNQNVILNEIASMAKLTGHSNIVEIHDYFPVEEDGRPLIAIVMEKLECLRGAGEEAECVQKLRKGDLNEIIKLGMDICTALSKCHNIDMMHRDVKPENIYVNKDGVYKLGDFGIAAEFSSLFGTHTAAGTKGYMAPEVEQEDGKYGPSADIYSLGMTMYRYYSHKDQESRSLEDGEAITDGRDKEKDRLISSGLGDDETDRELSEVILKACAQDPLDRYENAEEMKEDLACVSEHKRRREECILQLQKDQESCVTHQGGDLLIRGAAGSGKTLILEERAKYLAAGGKKVALLTYANTLNNYMQERMGSNPQIRVSTVDSFCMRAACHIENKHFLIEKDSAGTYKQLIRDTLAQHRGRSNAESRFYEESNREFIEDEIVWIREKCLTAEEEYVRADRKGRGARIRLGEADRRLVWDIYRLYCKKAAEKNYLGWPEIYRYILDNVDKIKESDKVDHILIDEAQDLTTGKLKVLRILAKESVTISADSSQKIYKTSFTWKEVGINLVGGTRSKNLSQVFRSTRQIMDLAADLSQSFGEAENQSIGNVVYEGRMPMLYCIRDTELSYQKKMAVQEEVLLQLISSYDRNAGTIGIICRYNKLKERIMQLFDEKGIAYLNVLNIKNRKEPDTAYVSLREPGIKIVTAHSAKGLEFDHVIIPELDDTIYPYTKYALHDEELDEEFINTEKKLLYVAMTRARMTLDMICCESTYSRFIEQFDSDHYKIRHLSRGSGR